MTLKELLNIHEVDVYPLSQAKDAMGSSVESLGTKTATLKCRAVPLSTREQTQFDQRGLVVTHRFQFSADPSLTLQTALVRNSQVFHVKDVQNQDGISWSWIALAEHMPQVEIAAP